MTSLAQRVGPWLTIHRLAQFALLIPPLIVLRTGGEYVRLKAAGAAGLPDLVEPLFIALASVGAVSILSLLLYFTRHERSLLVLVVLGICALIAYKLIAMPALG
jgi:hypothetical protein